MPENPPTTETKGKWRKSRVGPHAAFGTVRTGKRYAGAPRRGDRLTVYGSSKNLDKYEAPVVIAREAQVMANDEDIPMNGTVTTTVRWRTAA